MFENIDKIKVQGGKSMCIKMVSHHREPKAIMDLLIRNVDANLIYKDYFIVKEGKEIIYMVFEKSKWRDDKVEILCVNIQNLQDKTLISVVVSPEKIHDYDCPKEDWSQYIINILKDYILEVWEE